jgi:ACT domain-containing protein
MKEFFDMKAVVTVTGKDSVGIIARVSALCAEYNGNIIDITQSVLSEYFAMIMLVEIDQLKIPFAEFADRLAATGKEQGLDIRAMHEDIFNTMHHV